MRNIWLSCYVSNEREDQVYNTFGQIKRIVMTFFFGLGLNMKGSIFMYFPYIFHTYIFQIHIYVFLLEYLIINHIKCLEGKEWISRRMKISTRILWERWEKPFLRPFKLRSGWWAEVQHLWRRRGRVLVIQALRWEETSVAAAWWAEEGGWDRRKAVDTESSSLLKLAIW